MSVLLGPPEEEGQFSFERTLVGRSSRGRPRPCSSSPAFSQARPTTVFCIQVFSGLCFATVLYHRRPKSISLVCVLHAWLLSNFDKSFYSGVRFCTRYCTVPDCTVPDTVLHQILYQSPLIVGGCWMENTELLSNFQKSWSRLALEIQIQIQIQIQTERLLKFPKSTESVGFG